MTPTHRRKNVHQHPDPAQMRLPDVMAALSDPLRLGLMRVLADGAEHGWGELQVPVAKSTQSHHLAVLRSAGLIRTREEGTRCFVVTRHPEVASRFPGLLDAILAAADKDGVGHEVGLKEKTASTTP